MFQGRLDGITSRHDLAASLPPVRADTELIRQVVANLIDNAAEAMEGSTMRRLRVATRAESDGDAVEIEISDSGHGISPEDKEKLFLPHFSTKDRGTGLGLAIASRIIAEHNGTIRVEDNMPAGARFVIRFPAAEVGNSCRRTGHELEDPDRALEHHASIILIVDDESGIRESLGALLRDEGYEVEAVASGEECLEQSSSRRST